MERDIETIKSLLDAMGVYLPDTEYPQVRERLESVIEALSDVVGRFSLSPEQTDPQMHHVQRQ